MKKVAGCILLLVVTSAVAQVEIKVREVTTKDAQNMLEIGKPKAAREIALQCAARKDADCQMLAAQFLLNGVGGKRDDAQALQLLTASAEQDHPAASAYLGNLYFNGIGVKTDRATAVAWWVRSAQNCNSWAADAAAHSYFDGESVPQDLVRAYHWVSVAAHFEFPNSERGAARLGEMLDAEQRARAESMTKDFLASSGCGKEKQVIRYEPGTE